MPVIRLSSDVAGFSEFGEFWKNGKNLVLFFAAPKYSHMLAENSTFSVPAV